MRGFPTEKEIKKIKAMYPIGTRIKLISMDDQYSPIEAGTEGEIVGIDDCGTFLMKWDNGRTLGLIPFEDKFEVLPTLDEPNEVQKNESRVQMGGMSL
ncbi:DUF4314 domain-containing protein [Chakrabartyella piscis]|uniref:DUF4314 domain-containing protein n=1 Tax=Chakrabartyella piscis TaxID=2918914 RepID=UPI002958C82F|nr:DUF4314 domain-containing protein [Chakrabartyella piscis]